MLEILSRAFRAVPDGTPGKTRLARLALRPFRTPGVLRDKFGNSLFLPSLQEPISLGIFASGVYEPETLAAILEHLPERGNFLDIGANVGAISLAVAAKRPDANIACVEADPDIAAILRENAASNRANITVIPYAAGPENGSISFYRAPESKFGMGSIGPQFSDDAITLQQRRLDDLLLDPPNVIKLDIEGAEFGALMGLRQTIERHRPTIIFEFADWAEARIANQTPGDAQRLLMSLGYDLCRLSDRRPIRAPLQRGSAMILATPH